MVALPAVNEMRVQASPSQLKKTRWHEYAVRFLFGGLVTAAAGLIAKRYGPAVGGLFLAFPATLPAAMTLVEKHTRQSKERAGMSGEIRGRNAAALDAAGASRGSFGLVAFALLVWWLTPYYASWLVLTGSALAWLAVSVVIWRARRLRLRLAPQRHNLEHQR
jgi:hypothetical protein